MREELDTSKLKDILQNNWLRVFSKANVMKEFKKKKEKNTIEGWF